MFKLVVMQYRDVPCLIADEENLSKLPRKTICQVSSKIFFAGFEICVRKGGGNLQTLEKFEI